MSDETFSLLAYLVTIALLLTFLLIMTLMSTIDHDLMKECLSHQNYQWIDNNCVIK